MASGSGHGTLPGCILWIVLRLPAPGPKIVGTVLGRSFPPPMNPLSRRRAVELDGLRGFFYAGASEHLLERATEWIGDEEIQADQVLRSGRVFRCGEWAVKRYPISRRLRDRAGQPVAIQTAERHFQILPVRSPRPQIALTQTRGPHRGRGLLVAEFIDGPCLYECLESHPAACEAFPSFLADLHRRRLLDRDFHLRDCLWAGDEWALIDLNAVRHGLRSLLVGPVIRRHWIAILFWLELHPVARELFDEWSRILPWPGNRERLWRSAVIGAKANLRTYVDRQGSGPSGLRFGPEQVAGGFSAEES